MIRNHAIFHLKLQQSGPIMFQLCTASTVNKTKTSFNIYITRIQKFWDFQNIRSLSLEKH